MRLRRVDAERIKILRHRHPEKGLDLVITIVANILVQMIMAYGRESNGNKTE